MNSHTREKLLAAGFMPTVYQGQNGEYLAKELKASQMPYFMAHIVDNEIVYESDRIVVEVCPNDTVQLADQDADYFEDPVPLDSEEGRALLTDAGCTFE